jgi:hypothetical protein
LRAGQHEGEKRRRTEGDDGTNHAHIVPSPICPRQSGEDA